MQLCLIIPVNVPGGGHHPGGPVDPGWGVTPPVDPGWGHRPPVDPGYGRPGWSPVDPGFGHRPPVDPGFGVTPPIDPSWGVRPPVDPGYGRPEGPATPGWGGGWGSGPHPSHPISGLPHPSHPIAPGGGGGDGGLGMWGGGPGVMPPIYKPGVGWISGLHPSHPIYHPDKPTPSPTPPGEGGEIDNTLPGPEVQLVYAYVPQLGWCYVPTIAPPKPVPPKGETLPETGGDGVQPKT